MTVNPSGWKPSPPVAAASEGATATGNRALMLEEPLIFEIGDNHSTGVDFDDPPRNGEGDHAQHGGGVGATGRSKADAPEIDGEVHLRDASHLAPGDIVRVTIEDADDHDLFGVPLD